MKELCLTDCVGKYIAENYGLVSIISIVTRTVKKLLNNSFMDH